jgi:adenylate kinase
VNVGDLVKERDLHSGRDEEFDCFILDEDKVCDELEDMMTEGGCVVDFHTCDFFPERWFDLVVVLRVDNTTLFDRLVKRGYSEKKVTENVECEIMQVVLQEAHESYANEIVQALESRTVEDMESNVERISQWIDHWKQNNCADE